MICFGLGLFTIASGYLSSAPILVSPESSAAIKEGIVPLYLYIN